MAIIEAVAGAHSGGRLLDEVGVDLAKDVVEYKCCKEGGCGAALGETLSYWNGGPCAVVLQ